MSSRVIAVLLLIVFGAAGVARADVSLTDQQSFVRGAPLAAGQVPRLIDGTGLEWFINDEVTYATASSAVGAASDAVFTGPVAATTSGGGTELSILADAFDGYNALSVSVDGGGPVAYNQLGAANSDCDGRQILMPGLTVGGVSVVRKLYVPATDGFARWVNVVSNASGAARNVTLTMVSNLGSDAGTTVGATSDGDTVAAPTDDWVTSYEAFIGGSSPSPRLAHVLQSPGSAIRLASLDFADGDDTPTWAYSFSVPAGGTAVIVNFAAGLTSRSDAALKAAALAALPPGALSCMSPAELTAPSNILPGVVPSGPEPTGPASLTITSPTLDPTFTATTPFIGIGGLAGPSKLTGVTWTSNRGFSGTAQGGPDWSIPSLALLPGANIVTVSASYDDGGPPITDQITINLGQLSYLLSEGATGPFFSTDLLIANPNSVEVDAGVEFLKDDGTTVTLPPQTLPPFSRLTIPLKPIQGLESVVGVSSIVTSPTGAPLVVERTMFWDDRSYGSHGAAATEGARNKFYFGEGAEGFFRTFVLLANANLTEATATFTILPEGALTILKEVTIPPTSRVTVPAADFGLNGAFSFTVDSDLPISAERSMYFGGDPLFVGGHESPGVTQTALQWFFGEGATGTFFDTFFLLGNPSSRTANVSMKYQLVGGGTVTLNREVPPYGRLTLNAELEAPELANNSFSLAVTSDEPIIAERSMYWGPSSAEWYETHNTFGANEPSKKWGLAEGRIGGDRGFQTFILIGNSTDDPSDVQVTFLKVGGGTVIKLYTVAPNSRFTLDVSTMVPELVNEDFGAIVEVLDGSAVTVERSLYSTTVGGGPLFAAGTNTTAVRLP